METVSSFYPRTAYYSRNYSQEDRAIGCSIKARELLCSILHMT